MKKLIFIFSSLLILASCEKEKILPTIKIPSEISDYTSTHFSEFPIIQVIKDTDGFELTYDVVLKDGYFLEFNRKKEIIDIEGVMALPNSVIPANIIEFVLENYSNNYIIGWELDKKNQQVKLDNSIELEFDMNGNFIKIDS